MIARSNWDIATSECKKTIKTRWPINSVSFSSSRDQLRTNLGTFNIPSFGSDGLSDVEAQGSSFSVSVAWVLRDGQRLLWLPPENPDFAA